MPTFLYKADPVRGEVWKARFAERAPEIDFRIWPDAGDLSEVRWLAAWEAPPELVAALLNLEVLFSTGAGVDQFDLSRIPPHIQVVRLVDPGIVAGIVEYAVFAVLALHRDIPRYLDDQRQSAWTPRKLTRAAERTVGVLGLGELGTAVLSALQPFGFALCGWSRSEKALQGVETFSGDAGLAELLGRADILVCLLPLTDATRGVLDAKLFAQLPPGAGVINLGRGGHLVQHDLLAALDTGQLSAAVLDVATPEPLPPDHPFYRHPKILLTPHIAAMTHPDGAAQIVLANLRRAGRGEPMEGLVPRERGY